MGSEEESVRWYLDHFQDDRIVSLVLVFFEAIGAGIQWVVTIPIQAAALDRGLTVRIQSYKMSFVRGPAHEM